MFGQPFCQQYEKNNDSCGFAGLYDYISFLLCVSRIC